jgi:uncharacterized protein YjbI with pentapeptide repeats
MAIEEQVKLLKQGAEAWNEWRKENPRIEIDLEEADLEGADLSGVILVKANFIKANLIGAKLGKAYFDAAYLCEANLKGADLEDAELLLADLTDADLSGANLTRANLYRISLRGAILRGTNLIESDLREADLNGADLNGADLSRAKFGRTVLGDVDLSRTKGLEEVQHESMSTIGTDTIQRSKGRIPEKFLRGCGLSDMDIEYAKLASPSFNPRQVLNITDKIHELFLGSGNLDFSCFISYSCKDDEFARSLHDGLQNNGVRCWFAPEDLQIGDKFRGRIDDAIRIHDKLLIVFSENSIRSPWVEKELEIAFEKERLCGCTVLFPILLDDGVMNIDQAWAADICRTRYIADFSNWEDKESFQKAFERLVRDLKAAGKNKWIMVDW